MNQTRLIPSDLRRVPSFATASLAVALAFLCACGGGGPRRSASGFAPGSIHENPDPLALSKQFVVDPNSGGQATNVRLRTVYWGRLVDVEDATGVVQASDLVVNEDLTTNFEYIVSSNPITEKTTVQIRHVAGTPEYQAAYEALVADSNLVLVQDVGLNPVVLIPFIPRNAAIVLVFDDLLDPATIDGLTVRVQTGYPPETPYLARVVPDPNHGDLADFGGAPGMEFYSTRVIVDSTVSGAEAQGTALPVNSLGFPPSITLGQTNLQIRIPTRLDGASNQTRILSNLTNHPVSATGSGTFDAATPTRDITRSLRSGGSPSITNDPNNGFLADRESPSILGTQPIVVGDILDLSGSGFPGLYRTTLDYAFAPCASSLRSGDVIQQTVGGCIVYAEVVCAPGATCNPEQPATGTIVTSTLNDVYFRYVRSGSPGDECSTLQFQPQSLGQVGIRFSPTLHNGREACFITFSSIGTPPDAGVAPDATAAVRFSEPMDPASLRAFDTMFMTNVASGAVYNNFVVGSLSASSDLREFKFRPELPLRHTVGTNETYFLTLLAPSGPVDGARDLAGNPLLASFGTVPFRLDPSALTENTAGIAFRFDRQDMIPGNDTSTTDPGFNKPEFRGQFLIDGQLQIVRPRPVTRFQAAADRTQAIPAAMQPFPPGVQTPISRYGSKLQTIWRYCDVGFALLDEQFFNVDVERLYWAPAGGAVIADTLPRFEISLSHSLKLPDESLDPNLLPNYPNSGLITTYSQNVLDAANDPPRTVHPGNFGQPGYVVQPINATVTGTGTTVMPYPLNQGIALDRYTYFTWRNNALLTKGAPPGGPGAELEIVRVITGIGMPGVPFTPGNVPSIGLPLLMEFRCYPNNAISGQNSFDISLATASSARPNFRAFSTGGFASATPTIPTLVQPDLWPVATGGFNPNSTPSPGAITQAVDNSFYVGATDLVVRISRMHSIWFDSGSAGVRYREPILEPPTAQQPAGTSVDLAFRAATVVTNPVATTDAAVFDAYGEFATNPQPTFFNNDRTWKSTMAAISSPDGIQTGGKFFQMRITFVSNAATNLSPTLSALGLAWRR